MKYRPLGRTGLSVGALSLGTVSLGIDYGIEAPGAFGRPDDGAAIALLTRAVDAGINLIDTAPAYGASEALIGRVLSADARVLVATKAGSTGIQASLDASRRLLRRETLDIVQLHQATVEAIQDGRQFDALEEARHRGALRFIGASVYGEDAALAAIRSGRIDVLQIAFSVLDQRMAARVLPEADAAGVGVIVRSALLKGALTQKSEWLPAPLAPLRGQAVRARDVLARGRWDDLPAAAMRFCLSTPGVASVLAGARTVEELDAALAAETAGPFDLDVLKEARSLGLVDEQLLNPSCWPAL